MNRDSEFETRAKLAKVHQINSAYKDGYEKIHNARRKELYQSLLEGYRNNESPEILMRLVSRLCALEDLDQEFRSTLNDSKKYERRLKEIENERKEQGERDNFNFYNGG